MEKIHAGILFLMGFGLVYLGNSLEGSAIEVVGVGAGIVGGFLIIYSICRAVIWPVRKLRKQKPAQEEKVIN